MYGPAVDISPNRFQHSKQGFLPIPAFVNSVILKNYIRRKSSNKHITQGVFVITQVSVYFKGYHYFERNWYSALYITSGQAIVVPNSQIVFHSNWGIRGGAILIEGFSAIIANKDSRFTFFNNSAA